MPDGTCSVKNCDRPVRVKSKGWCQTHYQRWWDTGDVREDDPIRSYGGGTGKKLGWPENMLHFLEIDSNGCYVLTHGRPRGRTGEYRSVTKDSHEVAAHTAVYEWVVGPLPEGMVLDHLCKNPVCVHPDHLEPVTPFQNNMRSDSPTAVNARKTHCQNGHEFNEENTALNGDGSRYCRPCRNEWQRARRARLKASI